MHTITAGRIEAARHEIASMRQPARSQWAWTFTHPETGATCRAVFDGAILTVDVDDVPVSAGPSTGFGDEVEELFDATYADLEARGIVRSAVPSLSAVLRELRLVASDSLREITP